MIPFVRTFQPILLIVIFTFCLSINSAHAQNIDVPVPVINAENITRLQSLSRIDFADFDGDFDTGWFEVGDTGDGLLVADKNRKVFILGEDGNVSYSYHVIEDQRDVSVSIIDATFFGGGFYVLSVIDGQIVVGDQILEIDGTPVSIMPGADKGFLWIETLSSSGETMFLEYEVRSIIGDLHQQMDVIPYAPAKDPDALVRIGRIPPPYTVTSSLDGIVKLWNLQTAEVLASAQVNDGPAVFGNINPDATHLAWRNPESEALHLLEFESGEDQVVTELSGAYAQYFFLTKEADIILAVNLDFVPNVYAWDVATGQQYDLGAYRECNRIPDMVRLNKDGTTLVIGCDTGLDIWQVIE